MPQMHVLTASGDLIPMEDAAFSSEDLLQQLLAKHPSLMPGELIDREAPRQWILITREAGIGMGGDDWSGNRWSLDHLFLDQDGVPTLVEVKRSSDTRARREVVAQMLDYAANLWASWPSELIAERLRARCDAEGTDAATELEAILGPSADVTAYWKQVDANIAAGRIRLIFVADRIGPELRQIIEFLNSQFSRGEVLGIEVRQWSGENFTTLVSSVVGRSGPVKRPGGLSVSRLTEAQFLQALDERCPGPVRDGVRDLMDWCTSHEGWVSFGQGLKWPACYLNWKNANGRDIWALVPTIPTYVSVPFDGLKSRAPFDDPNLREAFRQRLNQIPGVSLAEDSIDRRPSFSIELLGTPEVRQAITGSLAWFVEQLKRPLGAEGMHNALVDDGGDGEPAL